MSNSSFHYWQLTDHHLKKAISLLSNGDDDSLTYACLELRKSLEAYAYDLLSRYLTEAPFRLVQRVWQADKVLKELLAIDPRSSSGSSLYMQPTPVTDPEIDVATLEAGPWLKIGEDRRLPVDYVRKNYQALGSFLHVPPVATAGSVARSETVRSKAEEIRDQLLALLAPGRISFKPPFEIREFKCDCGSPIARRESSLVPGSQVECSNCGQQFDVDVQDGLTPLAFSWDCPRCKTPRKMARSEALDGKEFACVECKLPVTVKKVPSWRIHYRQIEAGPAASGT